MIPVSCTRSISTIKMLDTDELDEHDPDELKSLGSGPIDSSASSTITERYSYTHISI